MISDAAMIDTKSKLIVEFLKDHQQFSRLLYQIEKLLGEGDVERAKELAIDLNRLAGPHIAYEESELYPRLNQLGEEKVSQELLVDQHHDALRYIRLLIESDALDINEVAAVRKGIKDALAHAEHCGSLISLMSTLDQAEQLASLEVLERLRQEGRRWTEL